MNSVLLLCQLLKCERLDQSVFFDDPPPQQTRTISSLMEQLLMVALGYSCMFLNSFPSSGRCKTYSTIVRKHTALANKNTFGFQVVFCERWSTVLILPFLLQSSRWIKNYGCHGNFVKYCLIGIKSYVWESERPSDWTCLILFHFPTATCSNTPTPI